MNGQAQANPSRTATAPRLATALVAGLAMHGVAIAGPDDDVALAAMIDTCAAGPTTLDQARSALTAAGPGWMLDAATERFAPRVFRRLNLPPRPVVLREAMIGDAAYADSLADLAAVAEFDPQVGTERTADYRMSREDYDAFLAEVAQEANIHISSHAALQEG